MIAQMTELEEDNCRLKKRCAGERMEKDGIVGAAFAKTVVSPSRQREMARQAVIEFSIPIKQACDGLRIKEVTTGIRRRFRRRTTRLPFGRSV